MCSKRGWRKPLLTLVGKLQTRMTSSSENILSLILSYRAAASRLAARDGPVCIPHNLSHLEAKGGPWGRPLFARLSSQTCRQKSSTERLV
jgi:hypothetical protein